MPNDDDDQGDDKPPPKVANLRSGLGTVDPDRYSQHIYPPQWDGPR